MGLKHCPVRQINIEYPYSMQIKYFNSFSILGPTDWVIGREVTLPKKLKHTLPPLVSCKNIEQGYAIKPTSSLKSSLTHLILVTPAA